VRIAVRNVKFRSNPIRADQFIVETAGLRDEHQDHEDIRKLSIINNNRIYHLSSHFFTFYFIGGKAARIKNA